MNRDQITSSHRSRRAYVYIRQSSRHQVLHHGESQRRQRSLVDRALELGWPREQVEEVSEDLGRSASRSQSRTGFQKMVTEVALGRVGLILALEVSRVSRGNRDWYHLLDICGITATLIGDGEGLYDPRTYNDRLLLGLKGTMSEAELHLMKQRLVEAMHAKAKRGEFHFRLPPGYVWDEGGRLVKAADEQVQSVMELVFERFTRLGTVHAVQVSLAEEGIEVPVLSGRGHRVRWKVPSYAYLHRVLTNPLYAGAYAYGKRQVEEVLDEGQRPRKRIRKRAREEWHVLIRGHHEGYVSWEQHEGIQRQIASNRRGGNLGAPREGTSLLQGLVLCGHCGRRMKVRYTNRHRMIRYVCVSGREQTGAGVCQSFGALRLERAVGGLVLEAMEPLGLEAMLEAARGHATANEAEVSHWRQRVERAGYEVELARRQYDAVDPANRLVARELERRWERALEDLKLVEQEAEARLAVVEQPLSERERRELMRYAGELPRLWNAPDTRPQARKRIVRCLIEHVVVTVPEEGASIQARVHWKGGEVTPVEVPKGRTGGHRYVTEPELVELVRRLAVEFSDEQIARILNTKKWKTAKGLTFTARRVTSLRGNHGVPGTSRTSLRGEDVYTADQASELLGVTVSTVIRWVATGFLKGTQVTPGAPWRVQVTDADHRRLTAANAPAGWLPLKGAARALGVSQQTVLHKLKSGELQGVRVRVGRRSGWRIRIPSTSSSFHLALFDETRPGLS